MKHEAQSSTVIDSRYVIGIDVGTGSARAGLFDLSGQMLSVAKLDISLFRDACAIVEQSSAEIWRCVCQIVRDVVTSAGVVPSSVIGLGFDATCSLVVLGEGGRSLAVGPSEDENRDIIGYAGDGSELDKFDAGDEKNGGGWGIGSWKA